MKRASLRNLDYKKYILKLGLTQTEARVILFLVSCIFIGLIYSKISNPSHSLLKNYSYAKDDSLFYAAFTSDTTDLKDSYKSEFIDTTSKFVNKGPKEKPAPKSIDINHCSLTDLMKLPGVGEKTAQNILDYRNKNGNFNSIEDILNVKGIGKAKLEKIRNFVVIR